MKSQQRPPGSYEPVKEKTGSYEPGSKKTGSYEPVKRTNGVHMNPLRIKRGSDEPRNIDNTWSFFTLLHPTSLRLIRRFGGQGGGRCLRMRVQGDRRLRTRVQEGIQCRRRTEKPLQEAPECTQESRVPTRTHPAPPQMLQEVAKTFIIGNWHRQVLCDNQGHAPHPRPRRGALFTV